MTMLVAFASATATVFKNGQCGGPSNFQGAFYSISLPIFDGIYAMGISFSALYTWHVLTLSGFWFLATAFTVVPAFPFLFVRARQGDTLGLVRH